MGRKAMPFVSASFAMRSMLRSNRSRSTTVTGVSKASTPTFSSKTTESTASRNRSVTGTPPDFLSIFYFMRVPAPFLLWAGRRSRRRVGRFMVQNLGQKSFRPFVAGVIKKRFRVRFFHDDAFVKKQNAVRDFPREPHFVGDDDHRNAGA